jgi:hypothetical protein
MGGRMRVILLEGSQAAHVHPSDKDNVKVETLEWLHEVVSDRGSGIVTF